jgi:hypothetical protein
MTGLRTIFADELRKLAVWEKGVPIPGRDASEWRRDEFGGAMRYSDYGNRSSDYGWEVDHIRARALGGTDDISNLRPLRCVVNAGLGGLLGSALGKRQVR